MLSICKLKHYNIKVNTIKNYLICSNEKYSLERVEYAHKNIGL